MHFLGVEMARKTRQAKRKKKEARKKQLKTTATATQLQSFQLFCLMTKVFVGAACAASASAAVATLTMNLALRQNTLKKEKRGEKKTYRKSCFLPRNGKLVSCCGSVAAPERRRHQVGFCGQKTIRRRSNKKAASLQQWKQLDWALTSRD